MDTKDWIALFLGAVGTTLGVVNYVRTLVNERVHIRLIPKLSFRQGGGILSDSLGRRTPEMLGAYGVPLIAGEVINLSKFPIVIAEVGLCEGSVRQRRVPILRPTLADHEEPTRWPMRLGARESGTVMAGPELALDYPFSEQTRMYVTTACETTVLATSGALKAWTRGRGKLASRTI